MLALNAKKDLGQETCLAAGTCRRSALRSCLVPPLGENALELVDGDEARAHVHVQGLDEGEDAPVEGRGTDAECLGRLASGVGEPLDAGRLADGYVVYADRR